MCAKAIIRSGIGNGKLDLVKELKVLTRWSHQEALEFVNNTPATTPNFDIYVA